MDLRNNFQEQRTTFQQILIDDNRFALALISLEDLEWVCVSALEIEFMSDDVLRANLDSTIQNPDSMTSLLELRC